MGDDVRCHEQFKVKDGRHKFFSYVIIPHALLLLEDVTWMVALSVVCALINSLACNLLALDGDIRRDAAIYIKKKSVNIWANRIKFMNQIVEVEKNWLDHLTPNQSYNKKVIHLLKGFGRGDGGESINT